MKFIPHTLQKSGSKVDFFMFIFLSGFDQFAFTYTQTYTNTKVKERTQPTKFFGWYIFDVVKIESNHQKHNEKKN